MTLSLHVDVNAWRAAAGDVLERTGDVIAVVKGNGYGFGRIRLAREAQLLGVGRVAVGTVHELAGLPQVGKAPLVLTPVVESDAVLGRTATLTVGSVADVQALTRAGRDGPLTVKLASSMRRYGVEAAGLPSLLAAVEGAGLVVESFALHLPLNGTVDEVEDWLPRVPAALPITVSHLEGAALHGLRARHPDRRFPVRLGTALWHGDKASLSLRADAIETRPVRAGERAGYRLVEIEGDGTLVMIGAGTAHGVHPLADGRSPFHFARSRLALIEPPHMHTAMAWVPAGAPCPRPGDDVDVQQPLTFVTPDRIVEA
jgi:alanine racemase